MDKRDDALGESRPTDEKPAYDADGVDLTQIRALRSLTPTERLLALVKTVRNLERLKQSVRRV